jgi:hypothetical protein
VHDLHPPTPDHVEGVARAILLEEAISRTEHASAAGGGERLALPFAQAGEAGHLGEPDHGVGVLAIV